MCDVKKWAWLFLLFFVMPAGNQNRGAVWDSLSESITFTERVIGCQVADPNAYEVLIG
jgi:hypothetical protein